MQKLAWNFFMNNWSFEKLCRTLKAVADPDLQIRVGGPQFGLKIRRAGGRPPGPLSWIWHCKGYIQIPNLFQAFRLWSVVFSLLTSLCIILTILTPGAGYQTPQSWPFPLRPTFWTYPDICMFVTLHNTFFKYGLLCFRESLNSTDM